MANMNQHGKSSGSRVAGALAIVVIFWASAFAVIKSAGSVYGAGELALLRFTVAGVVLGIASVVKGVRVPRGREVGWFFVSGLLGVAIYHPFLNYGEQVVSAGAASLLINSAPVWTAILATFLLNEKVSLRKAVGIGVSFAGISLLTLGKKEGLALEPAALFVVGSAVCAAIYVIVQKKYLSGFGALEFTLWTVWAGVILLVPLFGVQTARRVGVAPLRPTLEVVYLGIFPAAIAYIAFAYATVRMPASRVMTFMYLVPAMAMLIAWPYLGEVPTGLALVGGALAIGGVAIVNTAKKEAGPVTAIEEG